MTLSSEITFFGGWAGLIAAGVGYWYLQKQKEAGKSAGRSVRTEERREKTKKRNETSGDEKKAKKVRKPRVDDARPEVTFSGVSDDTPDADIDNQEFARQLSNAKAGTTLSSKPKSATRQKSVKQSKANQNSFLTNEPSASSNTASAPSSATGGDADDDLSATTSPKLAAIPAQAPEGGDIADMLEPRNAGPAVLRLTESEKPVQQKSKPAPKQAAVTETKKQRQNRQKTEAAKIAREEAEQERKALMEKQRRTAREAEGRAAKDGSTFMASRPPPSSAWTAPKAEKAETKSVDLLDTFEPTTNGSSKKTEAKPKVWEQDVPSEEEQMRLLEENDDAAWSTVSTKKGKKTVDSFSDAVKENKQPVKPAPAQRIKSNNIFDSVAAEDDEWEVA